MAVARWFLQVDTQPEVGEAGYDAGAEILSEFFRQCVAEFREPDLAPLGRQIKVMIGGQRLALSSLPHQHEARHHPPICSRFPKKQILTSK